MSAIYTTNELLILAILLVLLLAAAELGFRLGHYLESRIEEQTKEQISVIAGSLLAVLAVLLGFTVSMAVTRFETRKQLVLDEANAIGTSYLRTQLLPEPDRSYIANRLREYVNLRLWLFRAGTDVRVLKDAKALNDARKETANLQNDLWTRAVSCAQKNPNPVITGLLLESLNQVIDLDAARWMAVNNHVPVSVICVDTFVAMLAAALIGYAIGLAGKRNLFSECLLAISLALVLVVIIDVDRPQHGLVTVSQQPMIDLQQQLASP